MESRASSTLERARLVGIVPGSAFLREGNPRQRNGAVNTTGELESILQALPEYRKAAEEMREILLANVIMIGEVPSPTFAEEERIEFIRNRFTECGIETSTTDEIGNGFGIIPGDVGGESILLAAHADTEFGPEVDHTIQLKPGTVQGPGLGDDSLGMAVLATLPSLLDRLGIRFHRDIVMMAAVRGLGRGDLEGMRFFLRNSQQKPVAAVCVEGVQLGRLSYKSLGMLRGEIVCTLPDEYDWTRFGAESAIGTLNLLIHRIMSIPRPSRPRTSIVLGSIAGGGHSFSSTAIHSRLRFEVRSEEDEVVRRIWDAIEGLAREVASDSGADIRVSQVAHRHPGGIPFSHPLVTRSRLIMDRLSIRPRVSPSMSELSALIDQGVPGVTLGLARGVRLSAGDEELEIDSMMTGLAQLVGVLLSIDRGCCDER